MGVFQSEKMHILTHRSNFYGLNYSNFSDLYCTSILVVLVGEWRM